MTTKRASTKGAKARKASKRTTTKASPKKATARKAAAKTKPKARAKAARQPKPRDPRLPAVGSTLTRTYKGKQIEVKVLADGFEYEGETYRSLSGLARHIVGYMISGPVFFKLAGPTRQAAEES